MGRVSCDERRGTGAEPVRVRSPKNDTLSPVTGPAPTSTPDDRLGRLAPLAVIAAAMLFGTTGTAQALGPDGTTPVGVGTLRIVVGCVALWAFARRTPDIAVLRRHPGLFVLGAIGVAAYQPAFFAGTDRAGVALGTVVAIGSGPVFAGVIEAVWLRRPPGSRWLLATALTIAGGALAVFAGADSAALDPVGLVASALAGCSYAVYAIAAKLLITRGVDSTVALAWPFTLGAVVLVPFLVGQPLGWVGTTGGVVMLLQLGVLTVGLAYWLYGWGLRSIATSTAVTLTLAEPLTATLSAVVVLGERPGAVGWIGSALIVVGLVVAGGVRTSRRGGPVGITPR